MYLVDILAAVVSTVVGGAARLPNPQTVCFNEANAPPSKSGTGGAAAAAAAVLHCQPHNVSFGELMGEKKKFLGSRTFGCRSGTTNVIAHPGYFDIVAAY